MIDEALIANLDQEMGEIRESVIRELPTGDLSGAIVEGALLIGSHLMEHSGPMTLETQAKAIGLATIVKWLVEEDVRRKRESE